MIDIKGRGAQSNPKNRFERLHIEDFSTDELDGFFEIEDHLIKVPTVYLKDNSKSVIAKNSSEDLGFDYSFNPYRGCEHGCIYCYARPTHEFLGFSSGLDFETKIMVKEDAPALLEKELKKKSYIPKLIMFSGNTDCYQPVEYRLKLTRKALEVCLKYRNPVSIITKNSLVQRDVDIIKQMAELNLVSVTLSITSLDKELMKKMEPKTSIPQKRLETIDVMAKNKIPVGVNIAPVIPGLNDEEISQILKAASEKGAQHAGYIMLRLPYAVKDIFLNWLQKEFPGRSKKIENKIRDMRDGKLNSSEWGKRFTGEGELVEAIDNLYKLSCKKYGLNKSSYRLSSDLFKREVSNQLEIF